MAECSPSTRDNGLGTLRVLPPEMRDMVYAYSFSAGHTALARVSKAFNEDTKSALFRHGVHRMDIEYLGDSQSYCWKVLGQPSPMILPHIKNLIVRVRIVEYGEHDGFKNMGRPGSAVKSDGIMSIFTWNSHPDDKKGLFHPSCIAGIIDSANLKLQSHSLGSLLRQMVDQMKNPGRCVFECELPQYLAVRIPSSVFESMDTLRKFPCVVIEFSCGPLFCRGRAVDYLEDGIHRIATSSLNTMRILERRGELDQGPKLKIIHRLSYRMDFEHPDVKLWGDEPEDKDYGLGEWTEALGRVWPPKSA